ncbi:MAG: SMI1/KNR4 family protein [Myxococcota bacterium]
MKGVFDLLATRRVPSELLARMMAEDNEKVLTVDLPPSKSQVEALEAAVGALPADYREWIRRFGAAATPKETGIIFGISVSHYKNLWPPVDGSLTIAHFEEGDDVRTLNAEGVVSSGYSDWYPCFSSFVASVLCAGNPLVWRRFEHELRGL